MFGLTRLIASQMYSLPKGCFSAEAYTIMAMLMTTALHETRSPRSR